MDNIGGIVDIFKYNILIQKYNDSDYYGLCIVIFGYIMYSIYSRCCYISYKDLYILYYRFIYNNYKYKSSLTLEGQYITKHTSYNVKIRTLMSDNFKALWKYIILKENIGIYNLLECHNENQEDYDVAVIDDSLFIIDQDFPFEIEKNIFCIIESYKSDDGEQNNSNSPIKLKTKYISLTLFSFKYNISYLQKYVENIKTNYLKSIEDNRKYMTFYYKLKSIDSSENEVEWYEKEFITNKCFDSLYINNKKSIMDKIDFFLNNEQWYKDNGHPYTLGIGLHGPPGTGKTSFIKCLAKMTNRHIIEISLDKIKNENELYDVYYDNKYHTNNKEPIKFKNKIVIFEDIDCMSDIVLKREYRQNTDVHKELNDIVNVLMNNDNDTDKDKDKDNDNDNDNDNETKKTNYKKTTPLVPRSSSNLTLSALLNIMDGIAEDNGRILIMTSNYWSKLDTALVRPGRIDIEIKMGHIDESILNEYVYDQYRKKIPKSKMKKIKFENITPCIMINEYINSNSLDDFLNKLIKY